MQGTTPRQQLVLETPKTPGKPRQSDSVAMAEPNSSGIINLTMTLNAIFPHILESPEATQKHQEKTTYMT